MIAIAGELDLAVADRLQAATDDADARALVIDLRRCAFLDSTGIAGMARAH